MKSRSPDEIDLSVIAVKSSGLRSKSNTAQFELNQTKLLESFFFLTIARKYSSTP